ncbi:hypothetical protein GCM10020331_068930 [Ectobacillus funiculus]
MPIIEDDVICAIGNGIPNKAAVITRNELVAETEIPSIKETDVIFFPFVSRTRLPKRKAPRATKKIPPKKQPCFH